MSERLIHFLREHHSGSSCIYCGSDKKSLSSEFIEDFHYLSFTCSKCTKKNHYKVDFLSSGINHKLEVKKNKPVLEEIITKPINLR